MSFQNFNGFSNTSTSTSNNGQSAPLSDLPFDVDNDSALTMADVFNVELSEIPTVTWEDLTPGARIVATLNSRISNRELVKKFFELKDICNKKGIDLTHVARELKNYNGADPSSDDYASGFTYHGLISSNVNIKSKVFLEAFVSKENLMFFFDKVSQNCSKMSIEDGSPYHFLRLAFDGNANFTSLALEDLIGKAVFSQSLDETLKMFLDQNSLRFINTCTTAKGKFPYTLAFHEMCGIYPFTVEKDIKKEQTLYGPEYAHNNQMFTSFTTQDARFKALPHYVLGQNFRKALSLVVDVDKADIAHIFKHDPCHVSVQGHFFIFRCLIEYGLRGAIPMRHVCNFSLYLNRHNQSCLTTLLNDEGVTHEQRNAYSACLTPAWKTALLNEAFRVVELVLAGRITPLDIKKALQQTVYGLLSAAYRANFVWKMRNPVTGISTLLDTTVQLTEFKKKAYPTLNFLQEQADRATEQRNALTKAISKLDVMTPLGLCTGYKDQNYYLYRQYDYIKNLVELYGVRQEELRVTNPQALHHPALFFISTTMAQLIRKSPHSSRFEAYDKQNGALQKGKLYYVILSKSKGAIPQGSTNYLKVLNSTSFHKNIQQLLFEAFEDGVEYEAHIVMPKLAQAEISCICNALWTLIGSYKDSFLTTLTVLMFPATIGNGKTSLIWANTHTGLYPNAIDSKFEVHYQTSLPYVAFVFAPNENADNIMDMEEASEAANIQLNTLQIALYMETLRRTSLLFGPYADVDKLMSPDGMLMFFKVLALKHERGLKMFNSTVTLEDIAKRSDVRAQSIRSIGEQATHFQDYMVTDQPEGQEKLQHYFSVSDSDTSPLPGGNKGVKRKLADSASSDGNPPPNAPPNEASEPDPTIEIDEPS